MPNAMVWEVSQCFNRSPTPTKFMVNKWFDWQHLVWRSAGQDTSQHATPYVHNWYDELLDLCWFHLNCKPKCTNTIMVRITEACTEWCWSIPTFEEQNLYALQRRKTSKKKVEFAETCQFATWCPAILSCQTGMGATLLNSLCLDGETNLGGHGFDSINLHTSKEAWLENVCHLYSIHLYYFHNIVFDA